MEVTDPLDALAAEHGGTAAASQTADPLDAIAGEHGGLPVYRSTNEKDAAGNPVVSDLADSAKRSIGLGPAIGGAIGGFTPAGPAGAAIGGAAGEGYQQLAAHYKDILPAIRDVIASLQSHPGATLSGAVAGAQQGALDAGLAGGAQGTLDALGGLAMQGLGKAAQGVYRGYLKPSLAKNALGKADAVVQTGLNEALPITTTGVSRAQAIIGTMRAEVDRLLAQAPGRVNLSDIADKVRAFARQKYFKPGQPLEDYKAALRVADEIDQHPTLLNPFAPQSSATVSAPAANLIKRGLDDTIGASNFGVERGATKTAQKVGRYQIRQSLEALAPEIAPRNAREASLIDAASAINKAVNREANQSAMNGVKTIAAVTGGAGEYSQRRDPYEAVATTLALRVGLTPAVATRAAIIAYRLGKLSGALPATIARAAVAAASLEQAQDQGAAAKDGTSSVRND